MQKQINYIIKAIDELKINNSEEHHTILAHQKETNGNVKKNSEFRLRHEDLMQSVVDLIKEFTLFKGGFNTIKFLVSLLGITNVVAIAYMFIE